MSYTTSLPATGSHFISVPQAVEMIARYRLNQQAILDKDYKDQGILALSETFNRDAFDQLLGKTGCAGLRIYYGMDEELKVHAIIVAVNESNEDLLFSALTTELTGGNDVAEDGQRCPNLCPTPSPLNP